MSAPPVEACVGLSADEAARRLAQDGANDVPEVHAAGWWRAVGAQLRDTVVLVLVAAAVLTSAVGDWTDTAVIAAVVVLNTVLGAVQELRAARALTALAVLTAPEATVVRDGVPVRVPRATSYEATCCASAPATSSLPTPGSSPPPRWTWTSRRSRASPCPSRSVPGAPVHAGTVVTRGRADALVLATGASTELGAIAHSLSGRRTAMTPLQRQLAGLGRRLAVAVSVVAVVVAGLNLAAGRGWELSLVLAVSLAVAAIPESLPAVVTLALAVAARRMARRGVLVRNLAAVEGLGSITVLAVDKTGTVTEAACVSPPSGARPGRPTTSDCCSRRQRCATTRAASPTDGADDPLETALLEAGRAVGVDPDGGPARVAAHPRGAVRRSARRMTTTNGRARDHRTIRKGAPEGLAARPGRPPDVSRVRGRATGYSPSPSE